MDLVPTNLYLTICNYHRTAEEVSRGEREIIRLFDLANCFARPYQRLLFVSCFFNDSSHFNLIFQCTYKLQRMKTYTNYIEFIKRLFYKSWISTETSDFLKTVFLTRRLKRLTRWQGELSITENLVNRQLKLPSPFQMCGNVFHDFWIMGSLPVRGGSPYDIWTG